MESSRPPTSSFRFLRSVAGAPSLVGASVAGGGSGQAATGMEPEEAPSSDAPPRTAWRHAPLLLAAGAPSATQAFWLGVFALGAAALYWLTLRQKRLDADRPDPWADPRAVENALVLAQDKDALFEVAPGPGADAPPALTGRCVHLNRRSLLVQPDAPLGGRELAAWAGRDVQAAFCVAVGDTRRFYRFDSVVLRASAEEACPLLELARPARLRPYRRRAFSRISLLRPDVLALALWPLPDADARQAGAGTPPAESAEPGPALPPDPARLAAPPLSSASGAAREVRAADISASGLGLRLKNDAVPHAAPRCLIFLSLRAPGGSSLNLWLACTRRHLTPLPSRARAVLGLRVDHWAQVARADAIIPWKPVPQDGAVPPLLRWIVRRQAAERRRRNL